MGSERDRRKDQDYLEKQEYNVRPQLKSGMFLHVYCPKCGNSLIQDKSIRVTAETNAGKVGDLELSPYLDVFEHKTALDMHDGEELKDMRCPHCGQSLVHPTRRCGDGGGKTAELSVSAIQTRVPFFICLTQGCHWHFLTTDDAERLIQDSSDEW